GLEALAASEAGETRKLQAATALLDDLAQPTAIRRAALALLARSQQPIALTVIERASGDADPAVRADALEALNRQDPQRASVALGRAAIDRSAPWEFRLATIRRLGQQPVLGASRVLDLCVRDESLPLYARLQAVAALGHTADGAAYLLQIAGDAARHIAIRGAAARSLGAAKHLEATDLLIRLLDDQGTPPALAEACCDGLGALGARAGEGALLRLLGRTPPDVGLILAGLRALGRLDAPEMSEPISHLLGDEALHLLRHAI